MPTKDFEINLPQELNLWAARVMKRIRRKFIHFYINREPGGKRDEYTGDLYRKMWWTVHNAAGGNKAMIEFFYMKYGDFVQWGVGGKVKKWNVPPLSGQDAGPIKHPQYNRKAKPFFRREVKYHADWLLKRLAEHYAYWGNLYLVRGLAEGVGDKSITEKWIAENKDMLTKGVLDMMGFKG